MTMTPAYRKLNEEFNGEIRRLIKAKNELVAPLHSMHEAALTRSQVLFREEYTRAVTARDARDAAARARWVADMSLVDETIAPSWRAVHEHFNALFAAREGPL